MTGVSSLHGHAVGGSLLIKSIIPFLPLFIVNMIGNFSIVSSMPQPKLGYFVEKPTTRFLDRTLPQFAGAASFPRNPDHRRFVLKSSTNALRTGLLKGLKRV